MLKRDENVLQTAEMTGMPHNNGYLMTDILLQCIIDRSKQSPAGNSRRRKENEHALRGSHRNADIGGAGNISEEFAPKCFAIVLWLTLGCDSLTHEGALKYNYRTTAFLAHGLDSVYHDTTVHLAERIL